VAGRAVVLIRGDDHRLAKSLQGLGEDGKARGMDPVVVGHKDEWRHFSPIAVAPNLVIFAKKREFFLELCL
jgi:hypothetical protein